MRRFARHVTLAAVVAAAVALSSCAPAQSREPGAAAIVDARGESVSIAKRDRIVAVGGPVAEAIFAVGAGDKVVAVDTSSTYPAAAVALPKVGYQRTLAAEGVLSLTPDLVVASADAGPAEALSQIESAGVPVIVCPGEHTIDAARKRIELIGLALGHEEEAKKVSDALDRDTADAARLVASFPDHPSVLFLLARGAGSNVVAGKQTAADAMIALAGGRNVVTEYEGYRPLTPEAAVAGDPDVILTTSSVLEGSGGIDGILKLPGLAQTTAGKARRVVALDDLYLLGFGPRAGQAIRDTALALRGKKGEGGA